MLVTFKTASVLFAASATALLMAQPSLALDADSFVERLTAVSKFAGYTLEFGPASLDGDTITVQGVTITVPEEEPMAFEDVVTFSGVVEGEDGSYAADTVTVPDIDLSTGSKKNLSTVTVSDLKITDLWLPPADDITAETLLQTVGSVGSGPLRVTNKGVEVFAFDEASNAYEFSYTDDDSLSAIASTLTISNIKADLSDLKEEDPSTAAMLEGLGLTKLSGNISQVSNWTMEDGRIVVEEFLIDFADVGRLNLTLDISGFTIPVLDKVYALSADQQAGTDPEEAQARAMVAFLEIGQSLAISGANVRYDDAGVATRMLDVFAAQAGVERAQFANTIKPMVRSYLDQIGIPALTDLVAPPVEAFLDDPKNLEFKLAPPSKTSLLVLAAAAANPASLIKTLGVTVTANQ